MATDQMTETPWRGDMYAVQEAVRRWQQRASERETHQRMIRSGRVTEIESPERMQKRVERLETATRTGLGARTRAVPPGTLSLVETIGLERVIGKPDFLNFNFLELAMAVGRFVGRISIRTGPGRLGGYGTGFMVSPRLLLTNNHVLESADEARYSEVEFDYQLDKLGRLLPVVVFNLDPDAFFVTDRDLDFSLVAVGERSVGGLEINRYSWSRLIGEQGKAILGDFLNIIQHPKGREKQIVLRSNQLIDLFDQFAHYQTDTEPGSSGSPVYNDQWEVVALHHSGVPRTENGKFIAKDGTEWRPGMDPDQLDWIANEGIRVSSIVTHLKSLTLARTQARLLDDLLNVEPPHPFEVIPPTTPTGDLPAAQARTGGSTWTIPLHVTVSVGTPSGPSTETQAHTNGNGQTLSSPAAASIGSSAPPPAPSATNGSAPDLAEALSIDPDYRARPGYDPNFLGTGERAVPLPVLPASLLSLAAVNRQADGASRHVLPYHHFSVVINKERRLAFYTAVNIDGNVSRRIRRDTDAWIFDPRLDQSEQTGNRIYRDNPLDRGHLVRRLDPAWGESLDIARKANDDTFHYTNASPQHKDFNQNDTTWQGLENYILDNAMAQDLRVTVFTGPVFRTDDQEYRGFRLPREYWKVVVMVKNDGTLSATAYLLSQESLIRRLGPEAFSFGAYRTYQVPVRTIEGLAGFTFGSLSEFDPLERLGPGATESATIRTVATPKDIVF